MTSWRSAAQKVRRLSCWASVLASLAHIGTNQTENKSWLRLAVFAQKIAFVAPGAPSASATRAATEERIEKPSETPSSNKPPASATRHQESSPLPGAVTRFYRDEAQDANKKASTSFGHMPGPQKLPTGVGVTLSAEEAAQRTSSLTRLRLEYPTLYRGAVVLTAVCVVLILILLVDRWCLAGSRSSRAVSTRDVSMTQRLHDPVEEESME
ncbi:unnamed protein product [Amoebophrya sp. A120]|nr:unnamed protein product [Amoebophrya sp. A120]|eukprot:GSA120T00005718001.1